MKREQPLDQGHLDECASMGADRVARYSLYESYYDGEQNAMLSDRSRKYLERSGIGFVENFCEPVVDVYAERLRLVGFTLEDKSKGEQDDQAELTKWLDGVLQANRLDGKQSALHTNTILKGDGFLLVDFDHKAGIPRLTFNRPEMLKPYYCDDEPDTLEYVSKVWTSSAKGPQNANGRRVYRLNLYYPDRVEKFFKAGSNAPEEGQGGWERWSDEGETVWPMPWLLDGEPLGLPVFHFRHKNLGGCFGRSGLRGTIPQQDFLNKQVLDLADILDYQAWPQRWVKGVTADNVSLKPGPGEYLLLTSAEASAGQFDAADVDPVLNAIEATISRIARRSRTPLHLLTAGTPPSGEALKTAEAGLIAKVESAQTDFGQSWEDAALMLIRLAAANSALPEKVDTSQLVAQAQWRDPQTRNELAEAQRAEILKGLGVSQRTLLAQMDYDPDQELENVAREKSTLDEAAGRLLDAGAGAL